MTEDKMRKQRAVSHVNFNSHGNMQILNSKQCNNFPIGYAYAKSGVGNRSQKISELFTNKSIRYKSSKKQTQILNMMDMLQYMADVPPLLKDQDRFNISSPFFRNSSTLGF